MRRASSSAASRERCSSPVRTATSRASTPRRLGCWRASARGADEFRVASRSNREEPTQETTMPDQKIGTREEWQAARDELAKLEAQHAELGQKATEQRRQLPWVPVEKEYEFDTEDGKKTLAELFDGRSQLLAYNIMFGPDYEIGACPGCSNLGDELDATRVHLNHRDVTLICFS